MNAKEIVFGEGEMTREIYRLQSGWALGYRMNATFGRQVTGVYLPGDWISIEGINQRPVGFTCVALTNATFCGYGVNSLMSAIRSKDGGIDVLSGLWRERLLRLEGSMSMLQQTTAIERIAILILELKERLGAGLGSSVESFELPLKNEELARMIGLTSAHLSRTLADLKSKGILEVSRGQARILDEQKLRRIAIGAGRL